MYRGVSPLRRTGLRYPVEMSKVPLPQPVLDPERRSKVEIDESHGLWGFFREDKKLLNTPEEASQFGMLCLLPIRAILKANSLASKAVRGW